MRTESVELTVLCLIHKNGRYLLQDRIKNDWKGYTLPGGHIEPGESIVDAVIREMQEETGLTISHPHVELNNSHWKKGAISFSSLKQRNLRGTYAVPRKEPCIG